jgi:hypothetical protein
VENGPGPLPALPAPPLELREPRRIGALFGTKGHLTEEGLEADRQLLQLDASHVGNHAIGGVLACAQSLRMEFETLKTGRGPTWARRYTVARETRSPICWL